MPKVTQNSNNRLHNETKAAAIWSDGFEMHYWNGINVPKKWIENKSEISKGDILSEKNAERRRCMREILGSKRYAELLETEEIDSDTDDCGNIMSLHRTKDPDELINSHIYYYQCMCPSTMREYFLCVPECKNVWDAKAWTFNNEKIEVRHGDVGLLNTETEFSKPIKES